MTSNSTLVFEEAKEGQSVIVIQKQVHFMIMKALSHLTLNFSYLSKGDGRLLKL